jgi:Cdc6-like AAA superfamily ATPase
MVRLFDTVHARGEHAVIYGERGVGKTSLASVMQLICIVQGTLATRLNCDGSDNFTKLWHKYCEELYRSRAMLERTGGDGNDGLVTELNGVIEGALAILQQDDVTTGEAKVGLQLLADAVPVVIFFDEFDRLANQKTKTQLVDLMKALSDHSVNTTVVIVGVAETVDELILEHESISRGLNQILMPRMSAEELREVIDTGLGHADMEIDERGKQLIVKLSQGLPHYAHLITQQAALYAIGDARTEMTTSDVLAALVPSIERAQQRVQNLYHAATASTQQNIYPEVLLACALTRTDDRGFFAPGDVRDPLSRIMGSRYEIPRFARHLTAFADSRGPVLQKTPGRRPRYGFREPLLAPYVIMRGLSTGLISEEDVLRISDAPYEPSVRSVAP